MDFILVDHLEQVKNIGLQACKAVRVESVDGTDTLDLTTYENNIAKNDRVLYQDGRGLWHEMIVQSVETSRDEDKPCHTVYCVNSLAELAGKYILDRRGRGTTAFERLQVALDGTRWTVGSVENGTKIGRANLNFYHQTALKSVQEICDRYGLEVETVISVENGRVARRTVNLLDQRGNKQAGKRFEYGRDLKNITRTVEASPIITRLYAWGKGEEKTDSEGNATGGYSRRIGISEVNNGVPYVEDKQAQAVWGILEGDVVFDECTDRQELLQLAKTYLQKASKPQLTYEADVISLGRAGYDVDGVSVGDSVQIIDTMFTPPIRVEGRVLKVETDYLSTVDGTRITLGNLHESYTQQAEAERQKIDQLIEQSSEWNTVASGGSLYVRDVINRMNQVMNGTGGYTYLKPGEGIIVYDKPEDQHPSRAIQLGGGYWRTANSRKSDGSWDWKNIASGEGIFANSITVGRLQDATGHNWWDLDTGEFSLSSSTRVDGKTISQTVRDTVGSELNGLEDFFKNKENIFNALTDNGHRQGLYMSGGEIYMNASYIKTGIITGLRSYWDLTRGIIHMSDTYGNTTVHLDGNRNQFTGTFKSSEASRNITIDPTYNVRIVNSDNERWMGSGISFNSPVNSGYPASIAFYDTDNSGNSFTRMSLTNGTRSTSDPVASVKLDSDFENTSSTGSLYAAGRADDSGFTNRSGLAVRASVDNRSGYAWLYSRDQNGEVGVYADISKNWLMLSGALTTPAGGRSTFISEHAKVGYFSGRESYRVSINVATPARYGHYRAVASADAPQWEAMNCTVSGTGSASGWTVGLQNLSNTDNPHPVYYCTFGWLTND